MQLAIEEFSENLVEFTTYRVKNAKSLWFDAKKITAATNVDYTHEKFASEYAYAIPRNEFFENLQFDEAAERVVTAERYGGAGVGTNGGGARCGNHGKTQIKGIGKNPLAVNTQDHWHSYGGLNLVDAIYETINAGVFGRILPVGVATIYGIIITGNNTAILPGLNDQPLELRRSYGALLVREACVRPAHFFRCPFYRNDKSFLGDVARVRNVNKSLALKFSNTKGFVAQIGKYLANYANQFAFARAARISHGSISPSNMCLDGRWLDLTNTSFLDGARNFCGSVPFYNEPEAVMEMLEEFIYTFSKYNGLSLNPTALLKYFVEQFHAYFKMHISYVIGIPYTDIADGIANPDFRHVTEAFSFVISSAKRISVDRAYEYTESDPVISLIESLFTSRVDTGAAAEKLTVCIKNAPYQDLFSAFAHVMQSAYNHPKHKNISYRNFLISIAIISLKRAMVPEYFYMGRLEGYIYTMVKERREELFCSVIEESLDIADWAFDINEEPLSPITISGKHLINGVVFFKSKDFTAFFQPEYGRYGVCTRNGELTYYDKFSNFLLDVKKTPDCLCIASYNFIKTLERLGVVIACLESY